MPADRTTAQPDPGLPPLFVSSVEGHRVARYGTATSRSNNVLIGASTREKTDPKTGAVLRDRLTGQAIGFDLTWDTEAITIIPGEEYARFRKEYEGHIAEGGLKRRTLAEWEAQGAAVIAREKAHLAELAKAAEETKKAAEKAPASAELPDDEDPALT